MSTPIWKPKTVTTGISEFHLKELVFLERDVVARGRDGGNCASGLSLSLQDGHYGLACIDVIVDRHVLPLKDLVDNGHGYGLV